VNRPAVSDETGAPTQGPFLNAISTSARMSMSVGSLLRRRTR
jgi:hypothetical protein